MKRFALSGLLVLLAACGNGNGRHIEVTGQVEGTVIRAGSRIGGRVSEVMVQEGDPVVVGDVLVRLEDREAQARVAAAEAQVARAQAQYDRLVNGVRPERIRALEAAAKQAEESYRIALEGSRSQEIEAARARAASLREQRDLARTELRRADELLKGDVISQDEFDRAKHNYESSKAAHQAAEEELDLLIQGPRAEEIQIAKAAYEQAEATLDEARNGAREEDIAEALAMLSSAKADLLLAQSNADEMIIRSSIAGVIESLDVHPGDLVDPGPIVRIVDPEDLEVTVYVSAAVLGYLRLGQQVPMTTDMNTGEKFQGVIVQIATQGEFTPRNLQTSEERVQQVFGIKLDFDSAGGKLKAGMTITAHLDLAREAT